MAPEQQQNSGLLGSAWYNALRYHVIPPLFIVVFTGAVQWLALLGAPPCPINFNQCSRLLGDSFSWTVVLLYIGWIVFWLLIPSPQFIGPESPEGEKPKYQDNGMQFYVSTIAVFLIAQWLWPTLSEELVSKFPEILASLSILAFLLCFWLVIKARLKGKTSKFPLVYDFYRGCELHPRVLGCDAKQFAVSRVGMMLWQILAMAACIQSERSTADVCTLIMQTVYVVKFYWTESTYYITIDITYDRAGYYLCWGGMVWIPALFPISQLHMIYHPSTLETSSVVIVTVICFVATALEFYIDHQKKVFVDWRKNITKNEAKPYKVWGRPVQFIKATYLNEKGNERKSALLTSGAWGLARHTNYSCELICALLWCVPSAVGPHGKILPLSYFYFIFGLIVHRIMRDEDKCSAKYGKYWKQYCNKVPYRFIPYVF